MSEQALPDDPRCPSAGDHGPDVSACGCPTLPAPGATHSPAPEYVTEADKRISSFAAANAKQPCGGIRIGGAEPKCCEVHLLPWGHARSLLDQSAAEASRG